MSAAVIPCPMCAETIAEGAVRCRHCGTTFVVTRSGYCSACRAVRSARETGECAACGGPLLDVRLQIEVDQVPRPRHLGAAPAPTLAAAAAAAIPSAGLPAQTPAGGDAVHVWREYVPRQGIGSAMVIAAFFGLVVGCWFLDWAERPGSFVYQYWRGPLALPIVVLVLHGLLMWRGVGNHRPRGRRTLSQAEWTRRWRQNRRDNDIRGAYKPVMWARPRTILASLVWLGAAGASAGNLSTFGETAGVTVGAGGRVALAASLVGFVGTLLCLPTSSKRVVLVDSDGVIYGTKEAS